MNTQKIEKWCEKNLTNIKIAFNGKHYVTVPNFIFGDFGAGAHETVGEFEGKLWWCVYVSETIGTVLTEMVETKENIQLAKEQIENCIRCSKKLSKEEHEIDTGNLCEDCRKVTINEDAY